MGGLNLGKALLYSNLKSNLDHIDIASEQCFIVSANLKIKLLLDLIEQHIWLTGMVVIDGCDVLSLYNKVFDWQFNNGTISIPYSKWLLLQYKTFCTSCV